MSEPSPSGAWKKTPPEGQRVERRKMFGYPCAFVNGNLFCGTFQDRIMVRLGVEGKERAIAEEGAKPFEPFPGRTMKEYAEVPAADVTEPARLADWVARALEFTSTLPPKKK